MLVSITPLTNDVFWWVKPQWKISKFLTYSEACTIRVKVWRGDYQVTLFSGSSSHSIGESVRNGQQSLHTAHDWPQVWGSH